MRRVPRRGVVTGVRGKGGYSLREIAEGVKNLIPKGTFSRALGAVGNAAGERFGGEPGGAIGSQAGNWLGDKIASVVGFGGYRVGANGKQVRSMPNIDGTVPTFKTSDNCIRFCHREFICDVSGSVAFSAVQTPINPGLALLFPYLSKLAANFEQYRWGGLLFEYRPTSGSIGSTSPALGAVFMASQYDVNDPPFTDKTQMMAYEYATSIVPNMPGYHAIECKDKQRQTQLFKVRNGPVPSTGNEQFYDIAKFNLGTGGMPSVYTTGELWVTYDIFLYKPRLLKCVGADWTQIACSGATATAAAPFSVGVAGAVKEWVSTSTLPPVLIGNGTNMSIVPSVDTDGSTRLYLNRAGYFKVTATWIDVNLTAQPIGTLVGSLTEISGVDFTTGFAAMLEPNAMWSALVKVPSNTYHGNAIAFSGLTGMIDGTWEVSVVCLPYPPTANYADTALTYTTVYPGTTPGSS